MKTLDRTIQDGFGTLSKNSRRQKKSYFFKKAVSFGYNGDIVDKQVTDGGNYSGTPERHTLNEPGSLPRKAEH